MSEFLFCGLVAEPADSLVGVSRYANQIVEAGIEDEDYNRRDRSTVYLEFVARPKASLI